MTSKIHLRLGARGALTLAAATLIAACAGTVGTATTVPASPGVSPDSGAGSPVPASPVVSPDTGAGSPVPTSTDSAPAATAATGAPTEPPSGLVLTTDFVRNEKKGQDEFGLTEGEITRRVDATEGLIAQCMTAAGFEYFPVDYATARKAMDSNSKPSGVTADEFRKQFGYGVTTLVTGKATQSTLSVGKRNAQYKTGLSTADRVAYDRTLYGENTNITFVVALDQEDFSQVGGCTRAAVQLIFTKEEVGASFVNYQNSAGSRIDADPRVIAAYRDWSSCMRQAGYSYNNSGEIQADLVTRLDAITAGVGPDSLSAAAKTALTALQGEEKAIAAVDHTCDLQYVADIKLKVETEILGPAAQP